MQVRNEFKAGLFIIVAILLFLGSVLVIGREKQVFSDQLVYKVRFKDVRGLAEGAPVRMGGLSVGRVESINFASDAESLAVLVELAVGEKYSNKLRKNSLVAIETNGLLGDKFLSIIPSSETEILPEGGELIARDDEDLQGLMKRANSIVQRVDALSGNIEQITSTLKDKAIPQFVSSMETVSKFVDDIEKSDGLLKTLISDPKGKQAMQDLFSAISAIGNTTNTIDQIVSLIQNGDGLLKTLLTQKPSVDPNQLLTQFKVLVDNLLQASESLSTGEGSIGALLKDPSLYDNLVEITDGAKRSFILRQAIRQSLQK